jgi:uncharacterized protein (UPF0264 family)
MTETRDPIRPGLLVSVRSATEALAALAGGADVIDVKEPDRGPLGAADAAVIESVLRVVNGRVPVTAAMGELTELGSAGPLPAGLSLFKIGLAGCQSLTNWPARWREIIVQLEQSSAARLAAPTAVVYADWQSADAPEPWEVLDAALKIGCPALLIDTWDKSSGSLFDVWAPEPLAGFLGAARSRGLIVVLAGSLAGGNIAAAAALAPDFVAVRTAACDGGRHGSVCADRVLRLRAMLADCKPMQASVFPPSKKFLDNAREFRILDPSASARTDGPNFRCVT